MSSNPSSRQTSLQDNLHEAYAGEAAKAIRDIGETVSAQVGTAASGLADKSSELVDSAKAQVKTLRPN
jgi:hypothetical protein